MEIKNKNSYTANQSDSTLVRQSLISFVTFGYNSSDADKMSV
jgi:hypothetical protein